MQEIENLLTSTSDLFSRVGPFYTRNVSCFSRNPRYSDTVCTGKLMLKRKVREEGAYSVKIVHFQTVRVKPSPNPRAGQGEFDSLVLYFQAGRTPCSAKMEDAKEGPDANFGI